MSNAWDRAVAAERRWRERLGLYFPQPDGSNRWDDYEVGDLIKLSTVGGPIATYRVERKGRVTKLLSGGDRG